MGKPLQSRPETEKPPASPMFWGNAGALGEASRLWTHPEIPEALKGSHPQILQALNARTRESSIGEIFTDKRAARFDHATLCSFSARGGYAPFLSRFRLSRRAIPSTLFAARA